MHAAIQSISDITHNISDSVTCSETQVPTIEMTVGWRALAVAANSSNLGRQLLALKSKIDKEVKLGIAS